MDNLASAAVLGTVVLGLVSLARTLVDGPNKSRLVVLICLIIGIGSVWLVGASDWASEQIVLDRSLDSLNFWSQMLLGVLVGGFAAGSWEVLRAVKNVGDNQKAAP